MDMKTLLQHISDENQSFPEITKQQALEAYMSALIDIKDQYDALYFFASMNLLNAYVKKQTADKEFVKRYKFKHYINGKIEQIIRKSIRDVSVYVGQDVVYVSASSLQFSFHNVQLTRFLQLYQSSSQNLEQEWTGIRLQPVAGYIFSWAKDVREFKGKLITS
ncbi:hypothetical protein [Fictibacillus halophilus]|uniref:hypothetical protein n=1 Tax=Fictibacillus halophilus TaxID=1610490 RepID=UPI001CFA87F7|nr:hypothetical protein [Fictibacillus halophilus]